MSFLQTVQAQDVGDGMFTVPHITKVWWGSNLAGHEGASIGFQLESLGHIPLVLQLGGITKDVSG